ncbi:hypothetical protein EV673_3225 [Limnobacter thiooxidans]|uniref:Uncharacterized protein n=1 Tax=Limnobacter thiooxidans TaxID=131080 RepID=A0AA86J210_9BURK|nr:hypothetical protein [Limnobacter sp.]MCZ8017099.1 hypothetical protein [Limnobacter sp.]RZS37250.1 hypothetical protein EV673_3225 [Limnobacter thiooxidans]BET25494.1 hypothetical protein RGQ30_09950 [Limnobacter thiooxidans]
MQSLPIQLLQVLHQWAAIAYLAVRSACCHGWFEAFEHSCAEPEEPVCPVKQLIGMSVHEKTQ